MSLQCGIVGLPNVGKSTLFNALTKAGIAAENYPFCTIEPNVGVVEVPDPRLGQLFLSRMSQPYVDGEPLAVPPAQARQALGAQGLYHAAHRLAMVVDRHHRQQAEGLVPGLGQGLIDAHASPSKRTLPLACWPRAER